MPRYLSFSKETTFGTETTTFSYLQILSEGISPDNQMIEPETVKRDFDVFFGGPFKAAGGVDFFVEPENIGYLLKFTMGTEVTATVTTGVIDHTFTPFEDTLPPSFTAGIGIDDIMEKRYIGAVVGSMSLESIVKEVLTGSMDVMGQKESLRAVGTPTYPTKKPLPYFKGSLSIGGSTGAQAAELEAFRTTIDNAPFYDDGYRIRDVDGRFVKRVDYGKRSIDFSFDARFLNVDEYKRFLGSTATTFPYNPAEDLATVALKLTHRSIETITGTYVYEFEIDIPRAAYKTTRATISDLDRVVQGVEGRAYFDTATSKAISIRLRNGLTAAY